jgi:adhesin transport system membrane fusion protein
MYNKLLILLMFTLTCTVLVWSSFMELDIVAVVEGEVNPESKVKTIQHLEGGIIEKIFINEGDLVSVGQPLIKLQLGLTRINVYDLEVQYKALQRKLVRLNAEATGAVPKFADGQTKLGRVFAENEMSMYRARQDQITSTLSSLDDQVTQSKYSLEETLSRMQGVKGSLKILNNQLRSTKSLYAERLVTKLDYLELKNQISILHAQEKELANTSDRLRSARDEALEKKESERIKIKREISEARVKVTNDLARLDEQLAPARDVRNRETILSPIAGVIKNLAVTTIGGVIPSGSVIMKIVPVEDELIITGRLDASNIGDVQEGMPAVIKVSALNFLDYGTIEGFVKRVAPDSTRQENADPYYEVEIKLNTNVLFRDGKRYTVVPGMLSQVDIRIGTRSVIQYLIEPFIRSLNESFYEK